MRYLFSVLCWLAFAGIGTSGDCGSTSVAHAQGDKAAKRVERRLETGQAQFRDQDYQRAIRTLRRVVDDDAATTRQRARALELIGLARLIRGDEDQAREAFVELVVLDPGYELTDDFGSERIRTAFETVRNDFLEHSAPAKLTLSKIVRAPAGQQVTIDIQVEYGADMVKDAVIRARRQGEASYRETQMTPRGDDRWRARLPLSPSNVAYVLEYYIEGRDIGGRPSTRLGGPRSPRSLDIAAHRSRPWYRRWYVIAGAAVVGITAVIVVAARD